jgi:hypothetical protein
MQRQEAPLLHAPTQSHHSLIPEEQVLVETVVHQHPPMQVPLGQAFVPVRQAHVAELAPLAQHDTLLGQCPQAHMESAKAFSVKKGTVALPKATAMLPCPTRARKDLREKRLAMKRESDADVSEIRDSLFSIELHPSPGRAF